MAQLEDVYFVSAARLLPGPGLAHALRSLHGEEDAAGKAHRRRGVMRWSWEHAFYEAFHSFNFNISN